MLCVRTGVADRETPVLLGEQNRAIPVQARIHSVAPVPLVHPVLVVQIEADLLPGRPQIDLEGGGLLRVDLDVPSCRLPFRDGSRARIDSLQLQLQIKNTEQIVSNLRELNAAISTGFTTIPEAYRNYLKR